jgi:predicted PhzF superfamily epimerase YddE/YHI9
MEQMAPRYTDLSPADHRRAMAAIGLKASGILEEVQPNIVNTGNSFLVIALRTQADVKSIVPINAEIASVSEIYDLFGFYIFSLQTVKKSRDAGACMFARDTELMRNRQREWQQALSLVFCTTN